MKKILFALLMLVSLLCFVTVPVTANENITVEIDGKPILFDVQPQIINNRTMVPLRTIFEALGATVDWNNAAQTVTSTREYTTINMTINSPAMFVNGAVVVLDSPPCLVNGRTLVPVRAISEAFDAVVHWDGYTSTVSITTDDTKKVSGEYIIATDKGFCPFEYKDAEGNIVGIDIDVLAAIAEDQGFTYDLQYIGWDAAITACLAGQADGMIAGASITEERQAFGWIFSDSYFGATQGMAVAVDSEIEGFEDLAGKKVAAKNGTMGKRYAESIKEQYGFEIITFSTAPDMYQAVIGGQVVACFDDTPILKYNIKVGELAMKFIEGTESEPARYAFVIFDATNQELVDKFNAGLANIKENGKYDEIIAKYLG